MIKAFVLSMTTNSLGPTGSHPRCGPRRPNPPVTAAGSGFDVTWLKNFRSASISAQTPVVAGSMKPPNTSLVMGGPVRVASMVAVTGCATAAAAAQAISDDRIHVLDVRMRVPP